MKQIFHTKWFMATIAIVAALAVLVGGFLLIAKWIVPAATYRKADKLIEAGDYEQAYTLFRSLGDFRDAKDRLNDFLWVCDSYTADDATTGKKMKYHYTYDDKGNLLKKETTADGKMTSIVTYTYDDKGNELSYSVMDANGITISDGTTYRYDANGNVTGATTISMEESVTGVLYAYDERGNCVKATNMSANGTADERVYIYDDNNNLVEARHGDRVRFLYDGDGKLTQKISLNKDGKNIGTYTYDKNGKILSMTSDTSDAAIVCEVDRKGRILTREYKNFTPSSKEEYTYDRKGNVIKAVVEQVSEETTRTEYSYTYNKQGDLLSETVVAGEESHENRWTYDEYGNVLTCETAQRTAEATGWRAFLRKDKELPFARSVMFEFEDMKSLEKNF